MIALVAITGNCIDLFLFLEQKFYSVKTNYREKVKKILLYNLD